jgi:hypothetical protein
MISIVRNRTTGGGSGHPRAGNLDALDAIGVPSMVWSKEHLAW